MNLRVLVGVVAVLSTVDRAEARRQGDGFTVLGWAGTTLYYEPSSEDAGTPNEMGGSSASVSFGKALDGRTGFEERYFLGSEGTPTAAEKKLWKTLPDKAAWQALRQSSAPACAAKGPKGPNGAMLDVEMKGAHMHGAWKKELYSFSFDDEEGDPMSQKKATLTMKIARDGKTTESAVWSVSAANSEMGAGLSGSVRTCWSPDGKRVAFILYHAPGMMRDPGAAWVVVGPTRSPRVQLVADKTILGEASKKVATALEAAGFVPTTSKASNEATARAATVVYTAAGFEADAAKLAAVVPGGATVAKLDWKTPFDLVVGIGATAMK